MGLHQQLAPPQARGEGEARDRLADEIGVLNLPENAVVFHASLPAAAGGPAPHHDNARAVPAVQAAVLGIVDDRVHVALVHRLFPYTQGVINYTHEKTNKYIKGFVRLAGRGGYRRGEGGQGFARCGRS